MMMMTRMKMQAMTKTYIFSSQKVHKFIRHVRNKFQYLCLNLSGISILGSEQSWRRRECKAFYKDRVSLEYLLKLVVSQNLVFSFPVTLFFL